MSIPRFGSLETESGDVSFGRVGSIAVQVADDGVDLNDDVLGNLGLYGLSFDHLYEGNVLLLFSAQFCPKKVILL